MIAGGLVVRSAIVGIRGHHHLFIAHEVDVQGHADGQLKDMEDEDVSAWSRTGEPAGGRVEHLSEVGVQQVEGNWLIQSAWGEVSRAGSRESHTELGERVQVYGHQSVRTLGCDGHFNWRDGESVTDSRVERIRTLSVRAAHLRRVTPTSLKRGQRQNVTLIPYEPFFISTFELGTSSILNILQ